MDVFAVKGCNKRLVEHADDVVRHLIAAVFDLL